MFLALVLKSEEAGQLTSSRHHLNLTKELPLLGFLALAHRQSDLDLARIELKLSNLVRKTFVQENCLLYMFYELQTF